LGKSIDKVNSTMNDINVIKQILEMIPEMFGSNVETVIHDLSKENYPILEIFNGHVSGRSIGDTTDVFGPLDKDPAIQPTKVINYSHIPVPKNGKRLRASSIILKDENGKPQYGITINFDTSFIVNAVSMLSQFAFMQPKGQSITLSDPEKVNKNNIQNELYKIKMANGIDAQHLSKDDMKTIIRELDKADYFDHHGMITLISDALNLTRPTIYSYIKQTRNPDYK